MRAVKRVNTQPELRLRRALHAAGFRYRIDYRLVVAGEAVRPDVVFMRHRIAVYVDSCFWHACPQHGTLPKTNCDFWSAKLASNVARDSFSTDLLEANGWVVIRAWEHDSPDEVVERVRKAFTIRPYDR